MEFFQENWEAIGVIAVFLILAGERIALLTPTETDNNFFKWLRKGAKLVGLVFPDNPGKPKEPKL